ncbi:MAG: VWA domain-containing protein [Acidobacteriota bacterium]|nr:VWA domain-containing protein [Acidobacteriota bacterium]
MFYRSFAQTLTTLLLAVMLLIAVLASVNGQEQTTTPQNTGRPRRADSSSERSAPTPQSSINKEESNGQDEDIVSIETDLANLLFTAVDKNKRFVTTLRQEDMRVVEDGVPQQVFTFQRETDRSLSLAILIDTSASQERTLPVEKAAARAFVDTIIQSKKDEVAVISFTGEATIEQELTSNLARIRSAIDQVEIVLPSGYVGGGITIPGGTPPISGTRMSRIGTTAIWDAVWATAGEILTQTSDKTRRAIILLTDGVDTSSRLERNDAIDRAIKADTVIYTIGIGDSYNYDGVEKDTLRKLSERTGGRAYFPEDKADLNAAFEQIQQELRSQYLIAYQPTNKKRDGSYRKVMIEVINPDLRKQKLRLTYRQGYFAKSATVQRSQ